MNPFLWTDYWKLQNLLEDSLNRLECLKDCHLEYQPDQPLPDFVFPLQKVLVQALEELALVLQVRPEVQTAIQELLEDPQTQVLMERLAQAEAQEKLVEVESRVEVLEPCQCQNCQCQKEK